jgi:4-hydroxy-tetrahydrodipicolinate synthase
MSKKRIPEGVYAAALTPLHSDLKPHFQELVSHCKNLLERGCQGVVLFGTSGEGPSFSLEERLEGINAVTQKIDPQQVIGSNASTCIPETIHLIQNSMKMGCKTFLVAPPSFFKNITDQGVIDYYSQIIETVNDSELKILLYHIPQNTGVPIHLPIIEKLIHSYPETVIGLKESEGNLEYSHSILKQFPGFQLFVGNEKHIIETVAHGGSGSICGIANMAPELICQLYKQGKEAMKSNPKELEEIFNSLKGKSFIPFAKNFLKQQKGGSWNLVRPPLVKEGSKS